MEHVSMFDFETFKSGLQVQKSIFFWRKQYILLPRLKAPFIVQTRKLGED